MAPNDTIDIERVVREVVRRLRALSAGAGGNGAPTGSPASQKTGDLVVVERVVAWTALRDRLEGVKRVVAQRGAVITPAARDELRERGVALEFAKENMPAAAKEKLIVAACAAGSCASSLAAMIGGDAQRLGSEENKEGDLPQVLARLDAELSDSRLGLLVCDRPSAALLLANRRHALRAAQADSVESVDETAAEIGANLLVVDPRPRSQFEIAAIGRRFAAIGRQPCPLVLEG